MTEVIVLTEVTVVTEVKLVTEMTIVPLVTVMLVIIVMTTNLLHSSKYFYVIKNYAEGSSCGGKLILYNQLICSNICLNYTFLS